MAVTEKCYYTELKRSAMPGDARVHSAQSHSSFLGSHHENPCGVAKTTLENLTRPGYANRIGTSYLDFAMRLGCDLDTRSQCGGTNGSKVSSPNCSSRPKTSSSARSSDVGAACNVQKRPVFVHSEGRGELTGCF